MESDKDELNAIKEDLSSGFSDSGKQGLELTMVWKKLILLLMNGIMVITKICLRKSVKTINRNENENPPVNQTKNLKKRLKLYNLDKKC